MVERFVIIMSSLMHGLLVVFIQYSVHVHVHVHDRCCHQIRNLCVFCVQGMSDAGHKLVCVRDNPVSQIWKHRPDPPSEPVIPLAEMYTG